MFVRLPGARETSVRFSVVQKKIILNIDWRFKKVGVLSDRSNWRLCLMVCVVPPEVREWLASTFTRQMATTRRKADEKPKFRSVAHAIRAGIFVDRIYRRVTSSAMMHFPPEVVKVLKVGRNILMKFQYGPCTFFGILWTFRIPRSGQFTKQTFQPGNNFNTCIFPGSNVCLENNTLGHSAKTEKHKKA